MQLGVPGYPTSRAIVRYSVQCRAVDENVEIEFKSVEIQQRAPRSVPARNLQYMYYIMTERLVLQL